MIVFGFGRFEDTKIDLYLPQLFCCTEGSKPRDYFSKNDFQLNRTCWSMHCHLQLIREDVGNVCLCELELMSGSELKKKIVKSLLFKLITHEKIV